MLRSTGYYPGFLIAFFCGYCSICIAQTNTCEFGVSLPVCLKANIVQPANGTHSVFGRSGFDAVLKVKGADEHAMSFMQVIGWEFDQTAFTISSGHMLRTTAHCININPSVLLSSKWETIRYSIGIGTLINVGNGLEESENNISSAGGNNSWYTNLDTLDRMMNDAKRKFIPFISLGLHCKVRKHLEGQLMLEQTLINFYEPNATISYVRNYATYYFPIGHQPLYIGLRFFYFF